jgi:hypothetical protein
MSVFVLINVGCFLRVSLQTLTDITPIAFPVVPASAVFEISALTLWSVDLMRTMWITRAPRLSSATV